MPDSNSPSRSSPTALACWSTGADTWSAGGASSVTEPPSFGLSVRSESSLSEPIELDDNSNQISLTLSPTHRLEDIQSIRTMLACPCTGPRGCAHPRVRRPGTPPRPDGGYPGHDPSFGVVASIS